MKHFIIINEALRFHSGVICPTPLIVTNVNPSYVSTYPATAGVGIDVGTFGGI